MISKLSSLCCGMEATTVWLIKCIDLSPAVAMYGLQKKAKEVKKDFLCDIFHKDKRLCRLYHRIFFPRKVEVVDV